MSCHPWLGQHPFSGLRYAFHCWRLGVRPLWHFFAQREASDFDPAVWMDESKRL